MLLQLLNCYFTTLDYIYSRSNGTAFFMRFLLSTLLLLSFTRVSAQKDTLIRYFNSQFEPCKKKEASYAGMMIKMGGSWNTVVYDNTRHIVMRGNYLDKEALIKNGYFTYYTETGKRFLAGEFVQNQKKGLWLTWYPSGNPKDSVYFENGLATGPCSIHYDNGQKEVSGEYLGGTLTGKWLWYHDNGQLASNETWKDGLLEDIACFDTLGQSQGMNCAVSKLPSLKGLYGGFEKYLMDSLRYPQELAQKGLEGEVLLAFTVSKSGKINDLKIVASSHKLFTDEVLRVIRSAEWYPAVSHNRPLDYRLAYKIPFPFENIQRIELPELISTEILSK